MQIPFINLIFLFTRENNIKWISSNVTLTLDYLLSLNPIRVIIKVEKEYIFRIQPQLTR